MPCSREPERLSLCPSESRSIFLLRQKSRIHAYNETYWLVTGPLMLSKSTAANNAIGANKLIAASIVLCAALIWSSGAGAQSGVDLSSSRPRRDLAEPRQRRDRYAGGGRFAGGPNGARSHARAAVQRAPSQEGAGPQVLFLRAGERPSADRRRADQKDRRDHFQVAASGPQQAAAASRQICDARKCSGGGRWPSPSRLRPGTPQPLGAGAAAFTVLPGHLHRSAIRHFSHSGRRATQT